MIQTFCNFNSIWKYARNHSTQCF